MSTQFDIPALIDQMADELRQTLDINERTAMVGIHTGGVWIAQRLHKIQRLRSMKTSGWEASSSRLGKIKGYLGAVIPNL